MQEVKKHTAKIKEEALQCSYERQARMNRTIDETYGKLDTIEKVLQSIYYLLLERLANENKGHGQQLEVSMLSVLIENGNNTP